MASKLKIKQIAKEDGITICDSNTSVDTIISELDILLQQENTTVQTEEPEQKINKHTLSYRKEQAAIQRKKHLSKIKFF